MPRDILDMYGHLEVLTLGNVEEPVYLYNPGVSSQGQGGEGGVIILPPVDQPPVDVGGPDDGNSSGGGPGDGDGGGGGGGGEVGGGDGENDNTGAITATTVYSDSNAWVLNLYSTVTGLNSDPPSSWQANDYTMDGSWVHAVSTGASAEISCASNIWFSSVESTAQQVLIRHAIAVSGGNPTAANWWRTADDQIIEGYFSGNNLLASKATSYQVVDNSAIPLNYVVPSSTNWLCIWVKNTE